MGKEDNGPIKAALDFTYNFLETRSNSYCYHDYRHANDCATYGRQIAKAEDISKDEYEPGIAAVILSNLSAAGGGNGADYTTILGEFFRDNDLSEKEKKQIRTFGECLISGRPPRNILEMVLFDCKDIHLGLPDALERIDLMRPELKSLKNQTFSDVEWEEYCREYFVNHTFYTRYPSEKFGQIRSKNYVELEKRIEKFQIEFGKDKKTNGKKDESILSDKESEDLFKLAFRNYVNLITMADRKAHLLIEVNSLLASAIIAFGIRKVEDYKFYIVPIGIVLIVAAITIFFAILASKPLSKIASLKRSDKQPFFFGSYDRLDPDFKNTTWEKYSCDINELFVGNKQNVFDELIKESFMVRKVLSRKFHYLTISYKVFIVGQSVSLISFAAILFYYYNSAP